MDEFHLINILIKILSNKPRSPKLIYFTSRDKLASLYFYTRHYTLTHPSLYTGGSVDLVDLNV